MILPPVGQAGEVRGAPRRMRGMGRRSLLQSLGAAAIGISFGGAIAGGLAGCSSASGGKRGANGEEQVLNFYTWATYIGDTTLADFLASTGVDVNISFFANNDELFAKLHAGNPGFDVIVPSNDFVERMVDADMLEKLDHSRIPNLKNIDPAFIDVPYDPGRVYSVPYTWLTLGIGYRKSKVRGIPDSWKYLFDSPEYAGRISIFSEAGDVFRCCAKYMGWSLNALTPARIDQISAMLIRQKPYIRNFHDDNGQDLLLSGDVDLVLEYNGDIAQVMREDPDLDFVLPREGSEFTSDTLCIPKGAPRPDNAHRFINYILDAEVDKKITDTILYPTPNAAAKALMPPEYRENQAIFPPAAILAKCEYAKFNPVLQPLYEEALTRVRAA